jgi:ketosteroid isomerase-like protein
MNIARLVLMTLVSVMLGTAQVSPQSTQSDAEQEAREASAAEVQAFLNKDAEAMARLWSDDLIVTNPLNKFVTKKDVLGMVQSGFLVITSYDRRIEYAHVFGEMVILAGSETVVWGGRMPMAGKTQQLRFTAVWRKQEGHWQEVARHANIVPEGIH